MGNSSLVSYTKISPNKNVMTNKVNKKITIHHMAGNLTIEQCGEVFASTNRKASSNYGIGTDGRVGLYVEEKDRAWTSSNRANDEMAVTIEVANNSGAPNWTVSDIAYNKLIELCVDICKRNNIDKLVWTGDKNGTLTCHYMFAATACPGPYLKSKMQDIADAVNARLQNNNIEPTKVNKALSVGSIYNFFKSKGLTDAGVAGLLGNLQAESGIRSNNLQNSYESKLGMDDVTYTAAVNNKVYSKEAFVNDKAGYGLAQWTFWSRKKALYEYAEKVNHTIDSIQMQCAFLYEELNTSYKSVLNVLKTSNDVRQCSDVVLTQFEKPANQSDEVKTKRYNYSLAIYSQYKDERTLPNVPFLVKVSRTDLNVRDNAGTNYDKRGKMPMGTFTIVEVKQGQGSTLGWGKLKSGIGWISLDYVEIRR